MSTESAKKAQKTKSRNAKAFTELEDQLRKARSKARNATQREKALKEGIELGIRMSREARS